MACMKFWLSQFQAYDRKNSKVIPKKKAAEATSNPQENSFKTEPAKKPDVIFQLYKGGGDKWVCCVRAAGFAHLMMLERFRPQMQKKPQKTRKQKRAPENCHRLQCKSLFNVADLVNGMWKVHVAPIYFYFFVGGGGGGFTTWLATHPCPKKKALKGCVFQTSVLSMFSFKKGCFSHFPLPFPGTAQQKF